jgi:hypothetical protein
MKNWEESVVVGRYSELINELHRFVDKAGNDEWKDYMNNKESLTFIWSFMTLLVSEGMLLIRWIEMVTYLYDIAKDDNHWFEDFLILVPNGTEFE